MKVLIVSLYHPELFRGGAQQVAYDLFNGLKMHPDIEPLFLAAVDPSFEALYKLGAQISGFDGRPGEYLFLSRGYDFLWHRATSPELKSSFAEFLEYTKPDVVHFHHFLFLGIDLLTITRRVLPKARIVFTFHEFIAICHANGHMLRPFDGSLCSRASPNRCHQCFPDLSPEHFFLRDAWFKKHLEAVDVFSVPSRFMIERYASWGVNPARIAHVTNGQPQYRSESFQPAKRSRTNRFGFFGQFVDNKGVWLLLEAVQELRQDGFTDFVIELNGDNLKYASQKRRQEFQDFMKEEEERPRAERNVFLNGSYAPDQLAQRMSRVDWCVVPSVWWEIFGLVISEAWMFGRPVIAANVGGPRERITHDKDGLLFEVASASSLAETIRRAATEYGLWERLSGGITPPATLETMTNGFLDLYRSGNRSLTAAQSPKSA